MLRLNRLMVSNTTCSPLPGQDPELSKQIKINSRLREDIHRLTEELPMNNPCISLHSRQPLQDTVAWDPGSLRPTFGSTPNRQPLWSGLWQEKKTQRAISSPVRLALSNRLGWQTPDCYPKPDHDRLDFLHTTRAPKAPTRLPSGVPGALPLPTAMH